MKRFFYSIGLLATVIHFSLAGTSSVSAEPSPGMYRLTLERAVQVDDTPIVAMQAVDEPVSPTSFLAEFDWSRVNWTDVARMVYGKCGEWHDLAISVGWTEQQWAKLSYVIHRESRCNIKAFNKTDPNGGSRGLMQINGYWCRSNKYNPSGWLQAQGILNTCDDLYNPETNLRAGLAMWNYSQTVNKCGWRPWATRC